MSRCSSPAKHIKPKKLGSSSIIVTVTDDSTPSLLILDPAITECDLRAQTQSLKHLSASAPAIRSELVKNEQGELFMAPSSSKSRQKKFHRHFKTVPQEEKVLDYYSCALVGDILLQGFLYISENYFAFYSNVFGYVTKLLIPVTTVVTITKERTAKIFPNAVGIQTESERHVFASLISRDATYKLMVKVWMHKTKQSPSDSLIIPNHSDNGFDDTSGDIAIADDSSGDSGSGNDSALEPSSCSPSPQSTPGFGVDKILHTKIPQKSIKRVITPGGVLTSSALLEDVTTALIASPNGSLPNTPYVRHMHSVRSLANATVEHSHLKQTEGFKPLKSQANSMKSSSSSLLLILATILLVILFLSAAILLIRISNLQQKLTERPTIVTSEQFYQDLLKWQNRLHSNSAEEIHQFIDSNLQQIVKVRQSLEALSTLFLNGDKISGISDHSTSQQSLGNPEG